MAAGAMVFLGICLILAALIIMSVRIYQVKPGFVIKILKYLLLTIFWLFFSVSSFTISSHISKRHNSTYRKNSRSVMDIWGGKIYQKPPKLFFQTKKLIEETNEKTGKYQQRNITVDNDIGFTAQELDLKIDANIRQKGLLKFAGYDLHFHGIYTLKNRLKKVEDLTFLFYLPKNAGNISDTKVLLDGKLYEEDTNLADGIRWQKRMQPGEEHKLEIFYLARGTDYFTYSLGASQKEIKSLQASLITDFDDYRIPDKAMVANSVHKTDTKTKITWQGKNLITGQNISLQFKIENYGYIASKLFFYSPLSMALFLLAILVYIVSKEINLHAMHFLFIMGGFFIFYLLGSYLISYINVLYGILASLAVSTGIMLYYSHLIDKDKSLPRVIGAVAIIFQWIFSLAFFFPEHTGFLITLATIISFIALMKTTAKTDWENKF